MSQNHKPHSKSLPCALFEMEDAVPLATINGLILQGDAIVNDLWDVIRNRYYWNTDSQDWWVVVHATYILGAIGTKATVLPLIMSLRYAHEFDCDWIIEELPAIFGRVGSRAIEQLMALGADRSNECFTRDTALEGLAAITIGEPGESHRIFDFIASILNDESEDLELRGLAGIILIDFRQQKYEKSLRRFLEYQDMLERSGYEVEPYFDDKAIRVMLTNPEPRSEHYDRDWLSFYNEDTINKRRKNWKMENSWWGKLNFWWRIKKLDRAIHKLAREKENLENL